MKRLTFVYLMSLVLTLFSSSCTKDSNEGLEGAEGQGGEDGESGVMWNRSDTAVETIKGVSLTLSYDEASGDFKGVLENLNSNVAPQVRVEVHVYDAAGNSTEYGPTTPGDMQPGEKRDVVLSAPGAGNFVKFAMHPEQGTSSGGEGSSGEGNEAQGHEGSGS